MLTTNTNLAASELAIKYKQLWMVEDIFRSVKSLLDTGPIFISATKRLEGMCFVRFWRCCCASNWRSDWHAKSGSWRADLIRDLDNLIKMEVTIRDKEHLFSGQSLGVTGKVFKPAVPHCHPPYVKSELGAQN